MLRLISRLARDQRIRFLVVGATNTLVGYLVFSSFTLWVFADVSLGYLLSLAVSYAVGITLAFALYRRFVFPVRGHLRRDFARFLSVYVVAISINAVALPLLVEAARVPPLLAQLLILVVTTLLSFFGHKKFSFRRSTAAHSPAASNPEASSPEAAPVTTRSSTTREPPEGGDSGQPPARL